MKKYQFFIIGIILGMFITVIGVFILMPKLMIVTHKSKYDSVDETCEALKKSIESNNWSCPGIRNINKSTENNGIFMDRQVCIVELCKAEYAKDILTTNPEVSTLMPCAWGVYKADNGKVYISGMNMGLMGKMFGGNIAKVMGSFVAKDEENMLESVIKK